MIDQPPIPDPAARDEFASFPAFRMRFWRPLLIHGIGGMLILLVIFALFFANQPRSLLIQGMVAGAATGVLAMVYAFYFQTVAVHPQKLRAYSFWGTKVILEWTEIAAVRPIRIPGLLYLRLVSTSRSKKSVWLSLFLVDLPGFVAAVNEHAPPDNPLRQWLNTHLKSS